MVDAYFNVMFISVGTAQQLLARPPALWRDIGRPPGWLRGGLVNVAHNDHRLGAGSSHVDSGRWNSRTEDLLEP